MTCCAVGASAAAAAAAATATAITVAAQMMTSGPKAREERMALSFSAKKNKKNSRKRIQPDENPRLGSRVFLKTRIDLDLHHVLEILGSAGDVQDDCLRHLTSKEAEWRWWD